jgi:hypothetical protein
MILNRKVYDIIFPLNLIERYKFKDIKEKAIHLFFTYTLQNYLYKLND